MGEKYWRPGNVAANGETKRIENGDGEERLGSDAFDGCLGDGW